MKKTAKRPHKKESHCQKNMSHTHTLEPENYIVMDPKNFNF